MEVDYFDSYADLNIHRLMLEDTVRNECYRKAIFENQERFSGATVLDVGSGTGILSIFCAQAGAKKVFSVEKSDIYKTSLEIIKENGLENKIEVINSTIEDVRELPGVEKVDIIVSEWMGFFLLHEGMLDSFLYAREKFLKPGGLMFPESAIIYTAPCSFPDLYDRWDNVNGISMTSLARKLRQISSNKPETVMVQEKDLLTEPQEFCWLDFRETTIEDLNALKNKQFTICQRSGKLQGVCIWFEVMFPPERHLPVTLTTSPAAPSTHWKQTTIVLPEQTSVEEKEPIFYEITMTRDANNPRRYNLEMEVLNEEEEEHPEMCECYKTKCILTRAVYKKYEEESM